MYPVCKTKDCDNEGPPDCGLIGDYCTWCAKKVIKRLEAENKRLKQRLEDLKGTRD